MSKFINRLKRKIPQRKSTLQLFHSIASQVLDKEVQELVFLFKELYKKHYNQYFINLGRKGDQTSIRKIIALCRMKDWVVEDFVEYNVLWYKDNLPYRPLPQCLCGPKAEYRYECFLAKEGYDVGQRKKEYMVLKSAQERREWMQKQGLLPDQIEEAACKYADDKAKFVNIPANDLPNWLSYSREQLIERQRQKVWAEAKGEYIENRRKAANAVKQSITKGQF